MKRIKLTQGKFAWVSDKDFTRVNAFKWCAEKHSGGRWYAKRTADSKSIMMHRFILNAPPEMEVDHRNHDGLKNNRRNLRLATRNQQLANRRPQVKASTKFKGIYWNKRAQKWLAQIRVNYKRIHLGVFTKERAAAAAYDAAAKKFFGAFAFTNL